MAKKPSDNAEVDPTLLAILDDDLANVPNLDLAESTLRTSLVTLNKSVRLNQHRIEKSIRDGKGYPDKPGSHNCYLSNHAVAAVRELRQLEKHDVDRIKSYSVEQKEDLIHALIEEMSPEIRGRIADYIAALENETGLLE